MRIFIILFILALLGSQIGYSQAFFSSPPLEGVEGRDYWIVNYMDHDTSAGMRNYLCKNKTYDTHQGTDFVIRSFKTMDSGVYVTAAANGRVSLLRDGLFDRNKHTNPGGFGNFIELAHPGNYYSYYAHLMTSSLLVAVGDSVVAGQRLAKVGCSGNCTDPHVHFEVWHDTVNVDPFSGTCQTSPTLWITPPFYDTSLLVIDKGFTPYIPNLDTLKERYLVKDTFYVGLDTDVNFWIQMQGVRLADSQRVDWYTPAGVLWYSFTYHNTEDWWYDYFWTYIAMPTISGTWHAQYSVNNILITTLPFYIFGPTITNLNDNGETNWTVSPNSCKDHLFIQGNLPANESMLLMDITGRCIHAYQAQSRELSLGDIPSGLYLLKCGNEVRKLIKE